MIISNMLITALAWVSRCGMRSLSYQQATWCSTLFVFVVYLTSTLQRTYPVVAPDEHGLLFQAQYLAGAVYGNMGSAPYYHFGGAIPYVPTFLLTSNPVLAYKAVMATNAAMAALVIPLLVRIADHFGHRGTYVILLAGLLALWPSYFFVAHYAWSESTFRLTFLLAVVAVIAIIERPTYWNALAFCFFTVGTYAVHPRALLIPLLAVLTIVAATATRRVPFRVMLACLGGIVAFIVASRMTMAHLYGAVWEAGASTQATQLVRTLEKANVAAAAAVVAGQAWYQIVASMGLVAVGGLALVERCKSHPWTSSFILLAVSSVAAASVGQMLVPERLDHLVYGRYIDGASIAFVWLGLLALHRVSARWLAVAFVGFSGVLLLTIWHWSGLAILSPAHPNNIAGIGWFTGEGASLQTLFIWTTIGSFLLALFIAIQRPEKIMIVSLAILISTSTYLAAKHLYRQGRAVVAGANPSIQLLSQYNNRHMYWTKSTRSEFPLYHLQYLTGRHFAAYENLDEYGIVLDRSPPNEGFNCIDSLRGGINLYAREQPPVIASDEPIWFKDRFDCSSLGWHPAESWGRWSDGKFAQLSVDVSDFQAPVLQVHAAGLTGRDLKVQRVTVKVDGLPDISLTLGENGEAIKVPLLPSTTKVVFDLPDATSPLSLGINSDTRILALGIRKVCVAEEGRNCL